MNPTILIVEDEPGIADNIKYALSTEGFQTIWLSEGKGVLEYVTAQTIDLIVLDIGLPDVNGIELCKAIRKTSAVPIIFLTARTDEIDKVVGLEIGGDDYMVKPFSPRELSARVKAVLRRTGAAVPQPIPGESPFQIDFEKCKITYFSTSLDLSRYEYKLLEIFIARPGRIFSRDKLMEMVWDDPDMSMDRTVDAHIKNIRATGNMSKNMSKR